MAQYIKELYWDIDKDLQQTIVAQQGDIKSRYLRFHLIQNSLALDLSNCTVKIYAFKADGTQVFNNVTVENATNGQILVELTSQTLAISGDLPCQLKIYGSDSSLLSTRQFSITIKPSLNDSGVESTNEFTGLQTALTDTQKWNDEFASIYPNIETKYQTNLNNLSSQLADIPNNFVLSGGKNDGTTDNTAILNTLKTRTKKIYFPQNSTNNAVYYFDGNPFENSGLDGYFLSSDDGVILSVSSLNSTPLKGVAFENKIQIYVRDRDNTAKTYKQADDFQVAVGTDNDIEIGMKEPILLTKDDGNLFEQNLLTDDTTDSTSYMQSNYSFCTSYSIDLTKLANDKLGLIHSLAIPSYDGLVFSCGFDAYFSNGDINTSSRLGVVAFKDANNFMFVSIDTNKHIFKGILNLDNSQSWNESTDTSFTTKLTNAYAPSGAGFNASVRQVNKRLIEFYINGYLVGQYSTPFDISFIGSGMNHVYSIANEGIHNWIFSNPMMEYVEKMNIGEHLNIAIFGDSLTHSEGAAISWADFLIKFLKGQRGITGVTLDNFAISGQTASQQYSSMQTNMSSNYNVVCILIGTNDIQSLTDYSTFKTTITNMVTSAKQYGARVIIGVPPLWISKELTGHGFETNNYDKGLRYREIIKYVARLNGVLLADIESDNGRVGVDNITDNERDNLHIQTLSQINIAKSFTRSIIQAFTRSPDTISDVREQVLVPMNSWVIFGSDYGNNKFTVLKKGNLVTIPAILTGGTAASGTIIANLKPGYRPKYKLPPFMCMSTSNNGTVINPCGVEVHPNGDIVLSLGVANSWISLSNICFIVE
jgi:lysophospholipase L1-like esterase